MPHQPYWHDLGRIDRALRSVEANPDTFIVIPRRHGQITIVGAVVGHEVGRHGMSVHMLQDRAEYFVRLRVTKRESLVAPSIDALSGLAALGLVVRTQLGFRRKRSRYKITPLGIPVAEQVQRALVMVRLGG